MPSETFDKSENLHMYIGAGAARRVMKMQKRILNCKQVARMLRVGKSTVYLWAQQGYLPAVKVRQGERKVTWRFKEARIEAWLRKRTAKFNNKNNQ